MKILYIFLILYCLYICGFIIENHQDIKDALINACKSLLQVIDEIIQTSLLLNLLKAKAKTKTKTHR